MTIETERLTISPAKESDIPTLHRLFNLPEIQKYNCMVDMTVEKVAKRFAEGEYRFCLILWKHEPVTAAQLAKLCLEQLGWKRTTTYTIIKRLGERGILKNENGIVTALVSKDEAQACEIDDLVEKKFEGSLPTFIAAFTKRQDLSEQELDEVQQMIDRIRRGETQ